MRIGSHVAPDDPIANAAADGADCVQVFLSNPRGWQAPKARDDARALRTSGLPIYAHVPYLVNPASGTPEVRARSLELLQATCDVTEDIGGAGVVVHGGHATGLGDVDAGIAGWVEVLDQLETPVRVLIENTAGGQHAMARHVDDLAQLWEAIGDRHVGICLDTCHAHAAGEALVGLVDRVRAVTGRIDLVHCNDSRDEAGAGRDRHAHLGHGHIDPDLLVAVVRAADAPVIVETARDGRADDLAWLRERVA